MFFNNPYAYDLARAERESVTRKAELYAQVHADLRRRRKARRQPLIGRPTRPR